MKKKISEISIITMGQSPKSRFYNYDKIGLPFIQGKGNFGDKYPNINVWTSVYNKISEKGDILFTVRAPVGDINISNQNIAIGRGVASIKPKNINNLYLYYLLIANKEKFTKNSKGTIYSSITSKQLKNIYVNIHSTKLQHHIVNTILILLLLFL